MTRVGSTRREDGRFGEAADSTAYLEFHNGSVVAVLNNGTRLVRMYSVSALIRNLENSNWKVMYSDGTDGVPAVSAEHVYKRGSL